MSGHQAGQVRLLRVITRLNIGGPARQALSLSHLLRPEFETRLVAGRPALSEGELSDDRVVVDRVPLVRAISPGRDASAYRAIKALLGSFRPTIVHSHMAKAGALARLAASRSPGSHITVHTFHGHVLDGYFMRPVELAIMAFERLLARHTDALVAVSPQVRDSLLDRGIGRVDQWHVIPVGFDLSMFTAIDAPTGAFRSDLGLGAEEPLVGVLGRLAAIKDHRTLLDAIAQIPEAHLAILGDGELSLELRKHASKLGVSKRVHFVGWRLDVAAVMPDLDLVALTSRNEGTPVSLIEALASGKPVVATDVGGVRAVVEDGVSGLLAPPGDASAVARAIKRILEDRALGRAMGAAGRKHVVERFSIARLVSDTRHLYASLLENRVSAGVS